jgi:hypothetical protein
MKPEMTGISEAIVENKVDVLHVHLVDDVPELVVISSRSGFVHV